MTFELKIDEHLTLKIPREEEAEDMYAAIDKDRVHLREWLPWVDFTNSPEDSRNNIIKRKEQFENKESASFIAYYDGKIAASVGYISFDLKNKNGEIGYWLLSEYEGRGIMTECVKACIKYGFETIGLHRIVIKCDERNAKSANIPKRLGFTLEGTLRDNAVTKNGFRNTLIFGLLEGELF